MDFAKNNQRLTRVDMSSKDNNNNKNDDDDKHCELRSEFMILKSVTSCSKRVNYLHRDKKKYISLETEIPDYAGNGAARPILR